MDNKNPNSQVDLFTFFEGENPGEAQEKVSPSVEEQVDDDAFDFNTEENDATTQPPAEEVLATSEQILLIPASAAPAGMPVFEYAGASEPIKNLHMTFEDLRKEKAKDFPELEKPEKVSWTMDYGIFKTINDTGKTIAQVKAEIESSKEFLDAMKKSRKPVICKVKPRVSGQTKGVVSAYKGVFTDLASAAKAKKVISIIPSRDGRVYEIRNTEIGLFVTRTHDVEELDPIVPCFRMKLPRIPVDILQQVITFFRAYIQKDRVVEAMVNLFWDRQYEKYAIHVPGQVVSKSSVKAAPSELDEDRYLHVADIHSHNTMPARFSTTDNEDEKATRLYIVIGRLDRYFPQISVRMSNGGKYQLINPCEVLEEQKVHCPAEWHARVSIEKEPSVKTTSESMECDAA